MIAQERFQAITDLLAKRQKMTVHQLQEELGVSPATLRRDLAELEAASRLVRVRGAVVHPGFFRGEPSFAQRSKAATTAKRSIAAEAARLVPPQSTVMLDAGTTCLEVGRLLLARRDLTLVTHSLPLALAAHTPNAAEGMARVICLGGEVRAISGAMVGSLALSWLEHLRADWCFIGASGLSAAEGAQTTELSETAIKQAFLRRSTNKVLLADSKKWEHPTTVGFATWSDFDFWVTDDELDEAAAHEIQQLGPKVIRAEQAK
jgi:DeoR family fructose operon transcriptional repressor